jgi:hypothetical protein
MKERNFFIDAAQSCIEIFNDFDSDEIESYSPAIITAWGIGKELKAISDKLISASD